MVNTRKIFISSTAQDLQEYRAIAIHACQRLGFLPIPMEEFGPDPRNAVEVCRRKVEEADLYLGIFAHRYGYVPEGYDSSITEMEYNWAIGRKLPVLIFIIDDDVAWPPKLIDRGMAHEKLERFKDKLRKAHVIRSFKDPQQFREDLFVFLPQWREERTENASGGLPPSTSGHSQAKDRNTEGDKISESDEHAEEVEQLRELRRAHNRRFQALELQAATYGISAPPHVIIERDDIKKKIAEIDKRIRDLGGG